MSDQPVYRIQPEFREADRISIYHDDYDQDLGQPQCDAPVYFAAGNYLITDCGVGNEIVVVAPDDTPYHIACLAVENIYSFDSLHETIDNLKSGVTSSNFELPPV